MEIIDKLKNCEGCKRRRNFLKKMFAGIAGALLLPWKSAKANECSCIFCPDGSSYCLCCDSGCQHCWITDSQYTVIVCEFCNGKARCMGIGCPGYGCPPGVICVDEKENKSQQNFKYYWKLTLIDDHDIIIGCDDADFDAMVWFNAHKVTNQDGKRVTAKASHKFSPKENKA